MSTPYSIQYFPPAPVVSVFFGAPGEPPADGPFEAVIDTGADTTVVPKTILLDLAAPSLFEAQLRSAWGEFHQVTIYLVDIQLGPAHLVGIQVAADEAADEIILGRNVLNKLPLFLDGPKRATHIVDDATARRLRAQREGM